MYYLLCLEISLQKLGGIEKKCVRIPYKRPYGSTTSLRGSSSSYYRHNNASTSHDGSNASLRNGCLTINDDGPYVTTNDDVATAANDDADATLDDDVASCDGTTNDGTAHDGAANDDGTTRYDANLTATNYRSKFQPSHWKIRVIK